MAREIICCVLRTEFLPCESLDYLDRKDWALPNPPCFWFPQLQSYQGLSFLGFLRYFSSESSQLNCFESLLEQLFSYLFDPLPKLFQQPLSYCLSLFWYFLLLFLGKLFSLLLSASQSLYLLFFWLSLLLYTFPSLALCCFPLLSLINSLLDSIYSSETESSDPRLSSKLSTILRLRIFFSFQGLLLILRYISARASNISSVSSSTQCILALSITLIIPVKDNRSSTSTVICLFFCSNSSTILQAKSSQSTSNSTLNICLPSLMTSQSNPNSTEYPCQDNTPRRLSVTLALAGLRVICSELEKIG